MWGGYLEDIGTLLSGGFGDTYSTEIASTISSHKVYAISSRSRVYYDSLTSYNNLGLHPNVDELFNIIETAIKQNNLVGTFSTYDNICKQKTYVYNHQYAITEAFVSKSTRIVKLQNPWNRLEDYTKLIIKIVFLQFFCNLFNIYNKIFFKTLKASNSQKFSELTQSSCNFKRRAIV